MDKHMTENLENECNSLPSSDEKEDSLVVSLQSLRSTVEHELNEIDKNREIDKKKMDQFIMNLITFILKQKMSITNEINEFYAEKKATLQQAISDTKLLHELQISSTNAIIQRNLLNLTKEFLYSTKLFFKKYTIFEKSLLTIDKNIGDIIETAYEKPIKEHSIRLKEQPSKVILTNKGFIALNRCNEIINLETQISLVSENRDILDISTTSDGNLAYLKHLNDRFYCYIHNLENNESNEICLPILELIPSTVMFAVFKGYVFISSHSSSVIYRFEISSSMLTSIETQGTMHSHKVFMDGWCMASAFKARYFDFNEQLHYDFDIKYVKKSKFSLYEDIIQKINKGIKIFTDDGFIYLINSESKLADAIEEDKIFNGKTLREYKITNEELIFCLSNRGDTIKVTIQYYPII
ncbi:unnamed protein product [Dimorphilus gyrociliatus]|uniref:Uncharacterized protein n=1 Tax=Dimorphilus gyrociliatus TaxID=2664684 RepID=A0A7I8VE93_9ANNE|nr:unnamed protein product [Dimorphilus gyrociliatus]